VKVVRPARDWTGLLGSGPTDEDRRAVAEAWEIADTAICGGDYDLVVMDEVNIALAYELLAWEPVREALLARPTHVEVVLTGRGALPELVEMADLITDMVPRKHYYDAGVNARLGIEF